ncbi:hypothetical protein GTW25_18885 [Aliihoeflea aestuarii]|jgi:preprotein translocase subunit SecY|uniref:hypothetical protein n=1 Tax=Aliihoeflea aestuarii TaxID=453840 RepID=UPI002095AEB7|nr:hypothetical protein [Aliihoeflea aestuarii]MCO6393091.1 hypothetical protein [Aliihoeflea aestuarii]
MTDSAFASDEIPKIAWRAVAAVGLVLIVYAVGSRIPLPGLDLDAITAQAGSSALTSVLSIFALWMMPFFSALIFAELARVFIAPLARWEAAAPRNEGMFKLVVAVLALVLAAMQGYGIAVGLDASGLVVSEIAAFVPMTVACLVASTAFVIWLSDRIGLPYRSGGFWVLLVVPYLVGLPREFSSGIEMARVGAVSGLDILLPVAFLVLAAGLVVYANKAIDAKLPNDRGRYAPRAILLWPPFLASFVTGNIVALPLMVLELQHVIFWSQLLTLVTGLIAIPGFVWAYGRHHLRVLGEGNERQGVVAALAVVAGVQIVVCSVPVILQMITHSPIYLDGYRLIVVFTVMLAVFSRAHPAGD